MRKIIFFLFIWFSYGILFSATLKISFTSKSGNPAYKYVVVYDLNSLDQLAFFEMSAINGVNAEVPDNTDVFVLGIASSGETNSGYTVHEFMPVSKAVNSGTGEKTIELLTEPAFQLVFQNVGFPEGDLFAVDMDDKFLPVFKLDVANSSNKSLPAITLPLGKCYAVYILKELPHSGKMIYRMDNKGDGFCSDTQGNLMIDTDKAVAESVIARYENLISETPVATESHLEKLNEINNLYDKGDYKNSAGEAVMQSEELIFEEARINIDMYRKGTVFVKIMDLKENPVKGVKVEAVPLSTSYKRGVLAGIYDLDPSIFSNAVNDGFNFATVGTLWLDVEPTDDNYRWSYIDEVAGNRKIHDMGYELFGHSILYFLDFVIPEYLKSMDAKILNDEIVEHTEALANHYDGMINEWLVINEAHSISASYGYSRKEITEFTNSVIKTLNEKTPGTIKTINAAPDYFGQSMFTEMFTAGSDEVFSMPTYDYFKDLIQNDIDFDVIGQQMYNGGCVTLFKDYGLADSAAAIPVYDLVEMRRNLRNLQTLGKPVYVTEISVPASMNSECPGMGYWRKEWSEEVQAQFLERLLNVIMGEKDVHLVNYWDMQDKGSFIYKGGLMNEAGRKKPAYDLVKKRFGDFMKTVDSFSGSDGVAKLHLYAGEYEIIIDDGNKKEFITVPESEEVRIEYQTDTFSQENSDEESVDDETRKGDESGCTLFRI